MNAFFLTLAITQFYPPLQVGYLYTYWLPLAFVIGVGLIREAVEDLIRYVKLLEFVAECYHSRKTRKYFKKVPLIVTFFLIVDIRGIKN